MTFGAVGCFGVSSFVGRQRELREIKRLLAGNRLVTVTGPGGVGKSRIAQQAAVSLRRAYGDEIRYVDLAEAHDPQLLTREVQDPDLLAHLMAGALGLRPAGAGAAVDTLTAALRAQPELLVLDNCEHLLPACAILAETLLRACPRLHIIAASREPLRLGGEMIFPVRPLSIPAPADPASVAELSLCESVALFADRAGTVSSFSLTDLNAAAVAELCRRLDGLPLAIELAATRTRALAPAQILERLDERFALLSRGARTAPHRQRTLRACVDWSFELCGKQERLLWGRLSVFRGEFDLDAVEGICADESLPAGELLDPLAGLVDKSILTCESTGGGAPYRMLETFRDYGEDRLTEAGGRDDLRRRHRDWYQGLARTVAHDWFGPHQAARLARLDRELPNLRAALAYSIADPDGAEAALELAAVLGRLWAVRGGLDEGRSWLDRALARRTGPTWGRLEACYASAALAAAQGDLDGVRGAAEQAHAVAPRLRHGRADAIAACTSGILATALDDPAEAMRCWQRAVDGLAGEPAGDWPALALAGLGTAAALAGAVGTAASCHQRIIARCPADDESLLSGGSLASLGIALWRRGRPEAAAARLREGLRRLHRAGDLPGIARCLATLARIAGDERQDTRAATLLGAATRLRHTAGIPHSPGEQPCPAAFARGEGLTVDDAVAYGLGERRPAPPEQPEETPTPLTRREQQVAALVAQGKSNKDIAATLVISRRTAESHIEKILIKLGFNNRAQVAAWMAARQLAHGGGMGDLAGAA